MTRIIHQIIQNKIIPLLQDYVDGFNEKVFCFKRLRVLIVGQIHD